MLNLVFYSFVVWNCCFFEWEILLCIYYRLLLKFVLEFEGMMWILMLKVDKCEMINELVLKDWWLIF